jgi:hypothetical protein
MANEFIAYAVVPTPRSLKGLSHSDLYNLREKYKGNQEAQDIISAYEHQAFAREAVQENPALALPIAAAIPAYNIYKQVTGKGRSNPSWNQVAQSYQGLVEGLRNRFVEQEKQTLPDGGYGSSTRPIKIGI